MAGKIVYTIRGHRIKTENCLTWEKIQLQSTKNHLDNLVLITGGAKSGKSSLAEKLASETNSNVVYIATMPRIEGDRELDYKIENHQKRRPNHWSTVEKSFDLESTIDQFENNNSICIIDCLSLLVSNLMHNEGFDSEQSILEEKLESSISLLIESIGKKPAVRFIVVTNEVGLSVVPENKSARVYRELLGLANQSVAKSASTVYLCCSGIPIKIKGKGSSLSQ